MMNDLFVKVQKFTLDNSPTILTAVGVTGAVTSAFLAGSGGVKAGKILASVQHDMDAVSGFDIDLEIKEKVQLVWKEFIPAGATLAVTVVAVVAANHIGNRRAAALAAAYTLSEKAIAEYRERVVEIVGDKKERDIRDEIAQAHVDENPVSSKQVFITGGDVLCYDDFTGRYFKSNVETIKKAQNDTNYQILSGSYASLNEFHDRIGLPATAMGEEVGWTLDRQLEVQFSTCMSEEQTPCVSIAFQKAPIRDYYKLG